MNLAVIRSLRNRSTQNVKQAVRKLVSKNDHVRKRDRQDSSTVLSSTNESLLSFLSRIKLVSTTIIPETSRFAPDSRPGMYPKPVSVAVHPYGWLYFLCNYDETRGKSDLIKTRMHSPLDKCLGVKKQVLAKEVRFSDGIVSLCADDSKITIVDEEGKVDLNVRKIKSQAMAKEKFEALGLALQTSVVTVAQMKESLIPHKNSVRKQYTERVFESTTIKFWCFDSCDQPKFSSVYIIDHELLYATSITENAIVAVKTSLDGVGRRGSIQRLFSYRVNWRAESSLCIVSGKMFAVSNLGIEMIDFENCVDPIRVVDNERDGCYPLQVTKRGCDIIFSDPTTHKIYKYIVESATIEDFAGNGEENSMDGPAVAQCSFRQLCGIDVERTQCQERLILYLLLPTLSSS